jgi:hypothetical protein
MDAAIEALGSLVDYQVGDVTAAATFYMAEIYYGLSRALMDSERPAGLQAADLQEYELALEDEAYPFEERAIEVHEKNMELMRTGIYNAWIDKSLGKLADLMPARYAKGEISSGFLGSIDRYAYSAPASRQPPAPGDTAGEAAPATEPVAPPDAQSSPETAPAAPPVHTTQIRGEPGNVEVSVASAH